MGLRSSLRKWRELDFRGAKANDDERGADTKTATRIENLIVNFDEKDSFDHCFGTNACAANRPG